jgi:serine/threonine protein kinase
VADEFPAGLVDFVAGSQIASYQVAEEIGRGGMAVVYRARDVRLDRWVALKVLAPEFAQDDAFRQRFIRESRAAAAVDHPNIIPIFDAGEAGGVLFIAMRYVGGQDMHSLVHRAGPLPPERAVSVISQVASALDAAHALGLVHRDVKPANMLLGRLAAGRTPDHVYLSDFGISKQAQATTDLTLTGQVLGTLNYLAPEQIEGRHVDGRADAYSLACAAFEMLAGSPPFRRDQNMAIMWAQLNAPPPALTGYRRDLPPAVDQVMARALAKSPAERYASCLAFATALQEVCGTTAPDLPGPAATPPPGQLTAPAETTPPLSPAPVIDMPPEPLVSSPPYQPPYQSSAGPPYQSSAGPPYQSSAGPPYHSSDQAVGAPLYRPGGQPPGPPASQPPGPPLRPAARPPKRRHGGRTAALVALAVLVLAGAGYALLRHSLAASPGAASPGPAAAPLPTRPAAVVRAYYAAISAHDYSRAWQLGGDHTGTTRQQFVAGFRGTERDTVTVVTVSGHVVTARLTALQTDGTVKRFVGSYLVRRGAIIVFNVRPAG